MKPLSILRTVLVLFSLIAGPRFISNAQISRGPYLQSGSQTSITVHWRTSASSSGRLRIGTTYNAAGTYTLFDQTVAASSTEHTITITGLSPDTKYFYSIGTSSTVQQSGTDNYFRT